MKDKTINEDLGDEKINRGKKKIKNLKKSKEKKKIAKERKVIPDPIDDRKFHE